MTGTSYWRWIAMPVVLLAVAAGLALVTYAYVIKAQASSILQDVVSLKVGLSSQSDVENIAEKHNSHVARRNCKPEQCVYFFEIENKWLFRARLEPEARFQAWVTVADGRVKNLHAEVQRDTRVFPSHPSAGIVDEYVKYPEYFHSDDAHYGFPTPVGKPYLQVLLDSHATPAQRHRAYDLSLTCLVKLGTGCDLPCDYLPLAWRDWETELKSTGGFGDYYPGRARCK